MGSSRGPRSPKAGWKDFVGHMFKYAGPIAFNKNSFAGGGGRGDGKEAQF